MQKVYPINIISKALVNFRSFSRTETCDATHSIKVFRIFSWKLLDHDLDLSSRRSQVKNLRFKIDKKSKIVEFLINAWNVTKNTTDYGLIWPLTFLVVAKNQSIIILSRNYKKQESWIQERQSLKKSASEEIVTFIFDLVSEEIASMSKLLDFKSQLIYRPFLLKRDSPKHKPSPQQCGCPM